MVKGLVGAIVGGLVIVSAPSPVMGATDDQPTHFHIHTIGADREGRIALLAPERIDLPGHGTSPP